jgi:hypothetical protein
MKKTIISGTIILIAALFIGGVYFPNYPLMWMASTSILYEVIRLGLIASLTVLLFSNPPRAVYFRIFLASVAAVLGVSTIVMMFNYDMNLIDAIAFMEIAIIFGIEALETTDNYAYITKMKRANATN